MNNIDKRERKRLVAEINVVPYIDVMLVLLIIFMITTPLLTQGVEVSLPEAKAKAVQDDNQKPIIVTVDRDGNYFLNISETPQVPVTPQQLSVRIAAENEIAKQKNTVQHVYVKGDKQVDYGKVVNAMVLLQQAGISNIGLMTQPPSEG